VPVFKWSSSYATSVPEVDAEHREIFEIARRADRAIRARQQPRNLVPLLQELMAHVAEHFAHEERLMRAAKCPSYAWHKSLHESAALKAVDLARRSRRGDKEAAPLLLEFLSAWMNDHMRLADRIMGAHLRNHQVMRAAMPPQAPRDALRPRA
jgi:hemerythrin